MSRESAEGAERLIERLNEEIVALKESLRDVLDISEVEGATNLTVDQYCKIMGARILLSPESRFAV